MVFVNRRDELDRLSRFAEAVARGPIARHLAFTGVRRIGKSRLLSRFVETHPEHTIVAVQVDEASTTLQGFLLAIMRATIDGLARRAGHPPLPKMAGPIEIVAEAATHGREVAALVQRSLPLAQVRRFDGQQVFSAAVSFPAEVGATLNSPLLVLADEFQHLLDLAVYRPFGGSGRSAGEAAQQRLLQVVRALVEGRPHVGWVVTGSGVRLLRRILGEGPLMGRFDEHLLHRFDPGDCAQLATGVWAELGVDATDSAVARVYRLTQGHPFYADVTCREAALTALRLESLVSATHVDAAFLDATQRPDRPIWLACREMFDSLDARAPALRGILQALASSEPGTLAQLAEDARLAAPSLVYRYVQDLIWLGMLEERDQRRYVFADPVFRYWIANASEPLAGLAAPLTGEAARRAASVYQEAYLRERELHGTLSEGYMRDLCRQFAGQRMDGRRFGVSGGHVTLPHVDDVQRIVAEDHTGDVLGKPCEVELDLCFGTDTVWLGEVRRRGRPLGASDVALVARKAAFIRHAHGMEPGPVWIVADSGFTDDARRRARADQVYLSTFADTEAIRTAIATRRGGATRTADDSTAST
ncbi:MAG: ATP-binding protein [Chloroflexi bacterium]|nr:ATP-binding protein [Chloroflexota bacterium]